MQTVAQIALAVAGEVQGEAALRLEGAASLAVAGPRELSFFANPRELAALRRSRAGAILVSAQSLAAASRLAAGPADGPDGTGDAAGRPMGGPTWIVCRDARAAMSTAARLLRPPDVKAGVHPTAVVDPSAQLAPGIYVGPLAVVEADAELGEGVQIGPQAYVGAGAKIGPHCRLAPGAKVMAGCVLGHHVVLYAGAVIGSDGFGFAVDAAGRRQRMPQLGIVRLGDGCEIGANSCIDRGCLDDTIIGRGVKIDNQVQVGHNSVFGDNVVMCSQSGAAGSSTLGAHVMVGAQAGISDHLHIAKDVRLGARAGVLRSVETPGVSLGGIPAMPHGRWLRSARVAQDLPSWRRRIEALERQVGARRDEIEASAPAAPPTATPLA